MKYIISYCKPHNHYIDIEFEADNINQDELFIQLPAWRPGRYELGNFAKNIQKWAAFNSEGEALKFIKYTKDCWKIETKGISKVIVKYNYYAAELNAGSTFLDGSQLYMNPVNCCVYIPDRMNEVCELILQLPNDYRVAIGQKETSSNKISKNKILDSKEKHYQFQNYHELADTPFIASANLQHKEFICLGTEFNFWFQGECKPDWTILTTDFMKFISEQLNIFKHLPQTKYDFLFQILPYKFFHGVEHASSTVIALGPGYNLMKEKNYEDLLGVSCHELFHAWNIKAIRPIEMQPYDYSVENYSNLGYVCEGITTYYGDYLLFRSGIFTGNKYFITLAEHLQKHIDNFGRYNLSVAGSSFDTWLDGYVTGVPHRKTSIYTEGCLLAFVTDIFIRKNSSNKHSLDAVMCFLYEEFAMKGKGYTEKDYKEIAAHFSGTSYDIIYDNYIQNAADYQLILNEALLYIGCEMMLVPSIKFHEHALGIKVTEINGASKITAIFPNSVADNNGASLNDEIVAINNMQITRGTSGSNFAEWFNYFSNIPILLRLSTDGILKEIELIPQPNCYYKTVFIKKQLSADESQKENYYKWSKNIF